MSQTVSTTLSGPENRFTRPTQNLGALFENLSYASALVTTGDVPRALEVYRVALASAASIDVSCGDTSFKNSDSYMAAVIGQIHKSMKDFSVVDRSLENLQAATGITGLIVTKALELNAELGGAVEANHARIRDATYYAGQTEKLGTPLDRRQAPKPAHNC